MSPIGVSLLMLLGVAGFGWLAWRKLSLLTHLQPEPRWDRPGARLRTVLVNGLLQQRMIGREWRSGVMHAVIFLGFLALLVRKVQLLVIGWHEPFVWPGLAGGLLAALKDGVELAVLAALAYAFWRRYVRRPQRLEPNREALLVLVLITAIMLTDLAFDAFRFALFASGGPAEDAGIVHERGFAFAGSAIAAQLEGWPAATLQAGYRLSYWVQLATVFGFLVLLPTGEHFHIVTALPALFLRRGRPANRVPRVDLDAMMADDADASALKVGARTLRDLSWKDGFDAFTCTECGRCKDPCPTFLTGKPLSQKWVHDGIKRQLLAQREALRTPLPAGGEDALPALVGSGPGPSGGNAISEEALWACTTCGACEAACPIELEHLPKIFRVRQHQVLMAGEFPHALKPVFEAWESQGNPWGLPSGQRADWARDLDVPRWRDAADGERFELLFYVGSAQSYDPRGQKIARAFVQVLRAAGVRFAILGEDEGSTGECARRLGNEMLFQQLAGTLAATLTERRVRHIVTCDPHAFNALNNELPEFAPDVADDAAAGSSGWTVEHHSQCIARLVREGRLALAPRWQRVAFHDPCYLGRHNDEFAAPRAALRGVVTDALLEPALTREQAMCCGAGGGRMWLEETIGSRINVLRTEQLLATAPAVLATACPYCTLMLDDGLKTLGREQDVLVKDIAEIVAEALQASAASSAGAGDAPARAARPDPVESVITP